MRGGVLPSGRSLSQLMKLKGSSEVRSELKKQYQAPPPWSLASSLCLPRPTSSRHSLLLPPPPSRLPSRSPSSLPVPLLPLPSVTLSQ